MKAILISSWLFVGLAGLIYHMGPGREWEKFDRVNALLTKARFDVEQQRWGDALDYYDQALEQLPEDQQTTHRQLRLEKAKAQMMASQLPEARLALAALLEEVQSDSANDSNFSQEVRLALASAQYYVTWLMRLEGLGREEWEPEVEAARQNYKLLVENADRSGNSKASELRREDLEAAVRLARMDLSELQALPLPSQCRGCESGKCRGKSRRPAGEKPNQGAGFQPPGEGSGS